MLQKTQVDAGIFNIPGAAGRLFPGYNAPDDHPFRPALIATYQFRQDEFRMVNFWWARENHRPENERRLGLMIMGPKGCGKTTLPEQYLTRLGVPVASYTANRRTQLADIIGSKTVIGGDIVRMDGPLVIAMTGGYPFILNELDLMDPGELTGLNDVVERGMLVLDDGTVIKATRGFGFIATQNTRGSGDVDGSYAGTQVMNKSLMSRFVKMAVDYPSIDEETALICAAFPLVKTAEAALFAKSASHIRKAYLGTDANSPTIEDTISTREVLTWVELTGAFRAVRQDAVQFALDATLTAATEGVTQRTIREIVQRIFNQ